MDDAEGNRTYILRLQEDLKYSDGKNITAKDYAFGLLIQMLPAVQETGGQPIDASWLLGAEEYLRGEANCLKGLRLLGNHQISITVRAEALPWYFELSRLNICPYPISEIAPGHTISDMRSTAISGIRAPSPARINWKALTAKRRFFRGTGSTRAERTGENPCWKHFR